MCYNDLMDRIVLERILRKHFQPSALEVIDDSHLHAGHAGAGQGGHYRVVIVAEAFKGQTSLKKHRMIYDALSSHWKGHIHALSIKAEAP